MRESCTYGVVRGALSNERPYRDHQGFSCSCWLNCDAAMIVPDALANAAALQVNLSHSSFDLTLAVGAFASHLISGIPMSNRG